VKFFSEFISLWIIICVVQFFIRLNLGQFMPFLLVFAAAGVVVMLAVNYYRKKKSSAEGQ